MAKANSVFLRLQLYSANYPPYRWRAAASRQLTQQIAAAGGEIRSSKGRTLAVMTFSINDGPGLSHHPARADGAGENDPHDWPECRGHLLFISGCRLAEQPLAKKDLPAGKLQATS